MKGLYQILSEDYREYQLKEPIRKHSKQLIESTRPSKLKKQATLREACNDKKEEVIKGSEETDKKSIVKEDEDIEEISEDLPIEDEINTDGDPTVDEMGEGVPEGPTVIEKISNVALLSKDEIEAAMAEMNDEEKEALKGQFEAIKNIAMELFPEEVEEDIEEIKEEPEIKESEEVPAEPVKEEAVEPVNEETVDTSTSVDPVVETPVAPPVEAPVEAPVENTEVTPEEPLQECEISSFKVTRIAPKFGAIMIEAQTKDGLKYITGKNFNETEKTLDEAEIATDKISASNRFKSLLK